jgi:hypothetical protein
VTAGSLKINRAGGALNGTPVAPTAALNWATAAGAPLTVDLDAAGTWTTPTALVDPGQALPTPTRWRDAARRADRGGGHAEHPQPVRLHHRLGELRADTTRRSTSTSTATATPHTGEQLNDASLMTIALSTSRCRSASAASAWR